MKVCIAGSSGQVGRCLVDLFSSNGVEVHALVRKRFPFSASENIFQIVFDFNNDRIYRPLLEEISPEILVIALGTTRAKAGSVQEFLRVDQDYPIQLIRAYKEIPLSKKKIIFISSIGADRPIGTYLKAKAAVENEIISSGIPFVIARPSLLLADRQERRWAEELSAGITVPVFDFLEWAKLDFTWIKKYKPIEVERVAQAVFSAASQDGASVILDPMPA